MSTNKEANTASKIGSFFARFDSDAINLNAKQSYENAWRFPLQSAASRKEVVKGGWWLLFPVVGWLMNMGHRIMMVHRMHQGLSPWPAWNDSRELIKHGLYTFGGMVWYGWPGVSLMAVGYWFNTMPLFWFGLVLWALAVIAIPGYMTHYCKHLDPREIFNPMLALSRVFQGGLAYWKAWSIVLPTMLLSFLGLLGFGIGFAFTSVWFWQVAAFSFATVFTQRFELHS